MQQKKVYAASSTAVALTLVPRMPPMSQTVSNPFLDFNFSKMFDAARFSDFQKAFGEFKLPNTDLEGVVAVQRRNVEAVVAANQLAFEGYQAIARRQGEIVRQSLEETASIVSELMSAGTPEEKVTRQAEMVKAIFEKTNANLKELSDLLAKSNTEAADVLAKRVSDGIDEMQTLLGKITKK
jgi:phasin family protein